MELKCYKLAKTCKRKQTNTYVTYQKKLFLKNKNKNKNHHLFIQIWFVLQFICSFLSRVYELQIICMISYKVRIHFRYY